MKIIKAIILWIDNAIKAVRLLTKVLFFPLFVYFRILEIEKEQRENK